MMTVVEKTRNHDSLSLGVSPRGAQALFRATQALADQFGKNIAAHPEDWHMLQPQWLSDLSDARRARIEGDRRAGGTAQPEARGRAQRPGDDGGT